MLFCEKYRIAQHQRISNSKKVFVLSVLAKNIDKGLCLYFSRYYQPKKYRLSGISVPVSAKKISAKTNIGRALKFI